MQELLNQIMPYIVSVAGALASMLIVAIKTRTSSLEKKLSVQKKRLDHTPDEYLVIYNGKVFPYSDCELVLKSDYTYNEMIKLKGGQENETINATK